MLRKERWHEQGVINPCATKKAPLYPRAPQILEREQGGGEQANDYHT